LPDIGLIGQKSLLMAIWEGRNFYNSLEPYDVFCVTGRVEEHQRAGGAGKPATRISVDPSGLVKILG
jgi:hypothetical protein